MFITLDYINDDKVKGELDNGKRLTQLIHSGRLNIQEELNVLKAVQAGMNKASGRVGKPS